VKLLIFWKEDRGRTELIIKAPELTEWLVDEEEVYRMFGGCLPVERTTESSSLKHCGNAMDKEKKLRILRLGFKQV
jgi:hypothetical protein